MKAWQRKIRNIHGLKPLNSSKVERWLGKEKFNQLQTQFNNWYGPPVNIRDIPGSVWIGTGGEFVGHKFEVGSFLSAFDVFGDYIKRLAESLSIPRYGYCNAGFASISDALSQASSGNGQMIHGGVITKTANAAAVVASAYSMWLCAGSPVTGAASSATPGGRAPNSTTTGAMVFSNVASGTLQLTGADFTANVGSTALLLYDRLFDVVKTASSTANEAVSGTATRYQSGTATNPDYIGGNFLFVEVGGTALGATAHNYANCYYTNQASSNIALPVITGISGAAVTRLDMPVNTWFAPLGSGDTGVKNITQIGCTAVVTGTANFVIGHPIGVMSFPIANLVMPFDWLTNRNLAPRIFNDACLSLLELPKNAVTLTQYSGSLYACRAAP